MPEYFCSIWGKPLSRLAGHELNLCRSHGDACSRCYCKRAIDAKDLPEPVLELAKPDLVDSLLDSLFL